MDETPQEQTRLIQVGSILFKLTRNENGTYESEPISQEEGISLLIPSKTVTLAIFDSKSSPGDKHYVQYNEALGVYCTCTGFIVHKHCWHIDSIVDKLKEGKNGSR